MYSHMITKIEIFIMNFRYNFISNRTKDLHSCSSKMTKDSLFVVKFDVGKIIKSMSAFPLA